MEAPNSNYEKFFEKLKEISKLPSNEYKIVHLIGHFVKKYNETYNVEYQFKFNTSQPSKCFEMFQMKKLTLILTSNPELIVKYIDWIFENKIVKAKRRITSISFLTREEFVTEYKSNVLLSTQPEFKSFNRSTILPNEYKKAFNEINVNISTYGDLAMICNMNNKSSEIVDCLNKLNVDFELLKKVV